VSKIAQWPEDEHLFIFIEQIFIGDGDIIDNGILGADRRSIAFEKRVRLRAREL